MDAEWKEIIAVVSTFVITVALPLSRILLSRELREVTGMMLRTWGRLFIGRHIFSHHIFTNYKYTKYLIDNPNAVTDLGEKLHETVYPKYSLKNITETRAEFYRELIKKS